MYNSENDFDELVTFLRDQIREYEIPITRETSIEDDLGITGDEAEELIANFAKQYHVDINSFDFDNYFYDEPGIFNIQNRKVKPFTISHLEKAILKGRLDEEVINA